MVRRRVHYASRKPRSPQAKGAPKKAQVGAVVMGTAYTIDQIQELVSWLASIKPEQQVDGLLQFFERPADVASGLSNMPEISCTEFMELVLAAVIKTEQILIPRLEQGKSTKALVFISQSSYFPSQIREKASAALQRLEPEKMPEPTEYFAPIITPALYTPQKVENLLHRLESDSPKSAVPAAVEFIKNYPLIVPVVSSMPMLSVTEATAKLVTVMERYEEKIFALMMKKRLLAELLFISSLSQIPLNLRERAEAAAMKLQEPAVMQPLQQPKKPEAPETISPSYSPRQLAKLIENLESPTPHKIVAAVVEFLKNYELVVQAASISPVITVTELTAKAINAIRANVDQVFSALEHGREIKAVEFLARSKNIPEDIRGRAEALLKRLMGLQPPSVKKSSPAKS